MFYGPKLEIQWLDLETFSMELTSLSLGWGMKFISWKIYILLSNILYEFLLYLKEIKDDSCSLISLPIPDWQPSSQNEIGYEKPVFYYTLIVGNWCLDFVLQRCRNIFLLILLWIKYQNLLLLDKCRIWLFCLLWLVLLCFKWLQVWYWC